MPLHSIAVVIPAYNAESTVLYAIQSVFAQSSPPSEIIVVDDGSTDQTANQVSALGKQVKFIRQDNRGSAVARQKGTEAATADYVAYLDADDWWPVDKLGDLQDLLEQEDIDFLLADLQRGHPEDSPTNYLPRNSSFFPWIWSYFREQRRVKDIPHLFKLKPEDGLSLLLAGFPVFPSSMLVKRQAVHAVGGWDARFRRCQDFDLGLRIARRFALHYYNRVHAILGLHDVNVDSLSYTIKQTLGDISVLRAHITAEPGKTTYHRQLRFALAKKWCSLGYTHRQTGEYHKAFDAYKNALLWPGLRVHALLRLCILPFYSLISRNSHAVNKA